MASKPSGMKMQYFDGRGRGEILRLLLAKGGKTYEDARVTFPEWPAIKPTTPFGSMPVLTVNGKQYSQGLALAMYLARECGCYGSTNLENLMIDQILMCREDIIVPESKIKLGSGDEAEKKKQFAELEAGVYPKFMGFFNTVIKENKTGWAVGKKMTLADLIIMDVCEWAVSQKATILDAYPELKANIAKTKSDPKIKAYLAQRKETPF